MVESSINTIDMEAMKIPCTKYKMLRKYGSDHDSAMLDNSRRGY